MCRTEMRCCAAQTSYAGERDEALNRQRAREAGVREPAACTRVRGPDARFAVWLRRQRSGAAAPGPPTGRRKKRDRRALLYRVGESINKDARKFTVETRARRTGPTRAGRTAINRGRCHETAMLDAGTRTRVSPGATLIEPERGPRSKPGHDQSQAISKPISRCCCRRRRRRKHATPPLLSRGSIEGIFSLVLCPGRD